MKGISITGRIFLVLVISWFAFAARAQVFPIQSTVIITPPYSPYLSDYTAPGQQKFIVQLRANDITLGDYPVRFRLTLEGVGITIRTRDGFVPAPVTLTGGGIPLLLYGEDFLQYFQSANLDFAGLSKREFDKTGKLPEGVYRFSLEVLDYNRGTVVSNKGSATVWVILNDPPLLNLPRNDSKTKIIDPTNIPFTWTPRHTGSPNSAFSTDYVFRMVEIWPANRNPYDAFLSQPVLYELTTSQTQIVYGMAEPALIPGRKYAWQVQARDVEGRDLFKNQGRSEVYVFQFGDALGMPENFRKEGGNATTLSLRWEPAAAGEIADQYRVRYKPINGDRWYEEVTPQRWSTLSQLTASTSYETQVRAEKGTLVSEYSASLRVTTSGPVPFSCGTEGNVPLPGDAVPAIFLAPGDLFYSRNFKFIVTQVRNTNGTFDGEAMMPVPWFNGASVKVRFASVRLDKNYQMVMGSYRSVQNTGSELTRVVDEMHQIGEKKPSDQPSQPDSLHVTPAITYTVPGMIDSVFINAEGKIIVMEESGEQTVLEPEKDEMTGEVKETVIADGGGNVYVVEKGADGKMVARRMEGGGPVTGPSSIKSLNKLDRMILTSVRKYKKAIEDYWTANAMQPPRKRSGPALDESWEKLWAQLPACLESHTDKLDVLYGNYTALADSSDISFGKFASRLATLITEGDNATQERVDEAVCSASLTDLANKKFYSQLAFETELGSLLGTLYASGSCYAEAWDRYWEADKKYESEGVAFYAAEVRFVLCATQEGNCKDAPFSCGFTNGIFQELDWITLLDDLSEFNITREDVKNTLKCVIGSIPIGESPNQPTVKEVIFKCMTGADLKDLEAGIKEFIQDNWDEPYFQGQATAFALTLLGPMKTGIVKKLQSLPRYANKIGKFNTLARAKRADELVSLSKTLAKEAGWLDNLPVGLQDDIRASGNLEKFFAEASSARRAELSDAWKALNKMGADEAVRRNPDYLANVYDYAKRSGKKGDEVADIAKKNENGVEQFLDELEDTPASGHWDKNPFQRGKDIEDELGQNLPETFKTIDKYDFGGSGKVTSIKSLDLDAKTYQNASKLRARLNRYIDELDGFTGFAQEGVNIGGVENPVLLKDLELATPRAAIGEQLTVLNEVIARASSKGINFKVIILP